MFFLLYFFQVIQAFITQLSFFSNWSMRLCNCMYTCMAYQDYIAKNIIRNTEKRKEKVLLFAACVKMELLYFLLRPYLSTAFELDMRVLDTI